MLVANRGEIARRIMRSCQQLGLTPVVVYTEPDALSLHVLEAEIKVCLGSSPQDYTNIVKLVDAAVSTGYVQLSSFSGNGRTICVCGSSAATSAGNAQLAAVVASQLQQLYPCESMACANNLNGLNSLNAPCAGVWHATQATAF